MAFHQEGEDDEDIASMHIPCFENHMKANEISKGIQIEKEAQSLFGSSRQGAGPNQVRVHFGLQE
jgi:hypothetical protein